jgi:hypothetical protein
MGRLSREKGKRAEREIATFLRGVVQEVYGEEAPLVIERNQNQSADGGVDIVGIDFLAVEVKHHAKPALNSWWRQTLEQASILSEKRRFCTDGDEMTSREKTSSPSPSPSWSRERPLPVLFWKIHGGKWNVRTMVRIPIALGASTQTAGDISLTAFQEWLKQRLLADKHLAEQSNTK